MPIGDFMKNNYNDELIIDTRKISLEEELCILSTLAKIGFSTHIEELCKNTKKVIIRKPGENKGITTEQRANEEKFKPRAGEQGEDDKRIAERLKNDPEFKRKALMYQHKRNSSEAYDEAVQEIDPEMKPAVSTKKRSQGYITQFNRRKNAPDAKLINKETKFEKSLKKSFEVLNKINDKLDNIENIINENQLKDKPFANNKNKRSMNILKDKVEAIKYIKDIKDKNPNIDIGSAIPQSDPKMQKSRCWEGYEPTPGKKAYEKGSCQPVKKQDDLEVAPKKSKNRKTYLESFGKSDVQVNIYDNSDIELVIGEDVSGETEQTLVKAILEKNYEEILEKKKQWSPKAKHKSDKGGLTAAGRASYNKATGGNLKAPQPGGGPRKRSFCARNAGQIRMHNIDCRKTPDKRACKARRRWKC